MIRATGEYARAPGSTGRHGSEPLVTYRRLHRLGPLRGIRRRLRPVVSCGGVVVNPGQDGGVDVDGGVIEAGNAVDQLVMGLVGDRMGLDDTDRVVDGELGLGAHPVPDPAQLDAVDAPDSGHLTQGRLGGVD